MTTHIPTTTCPQCAEDLVFPRGQSAYCENCGWPDECREPDESLIEKSEGKIIFIHDVECPGFCDYACNPKGQLQAELLQKQRTILLTGSSLEPLNSCPHSDDKQNCPARGRGECDCEITPSLLEWDKEWGGATSPEKRGYMRGDRSTTLFIINREVHGPDCVLFGCFVTDENEASKPIYPNEDIAKNEAEQLTREWLIKHAALVTAPHSHAPAPEHNPRNS